MAAEGDDGPGLVVPPVLEQALYVAALAAHFAFPRRFLPGGWLPLALGLPVLAAALLLVATGFATMRRAGVDPYPRAAPGGLVARGPFRISRNPIYLGFAALMLGVALSLNGLWLLLVVPVFVALATAQIRREERYLERRFGGPYLEYKARVRRWL